MFFVIPSQRKWSVEPVSAGFQPNTVHLRVLETQTSGMEPVSAGFQPASNAAHREALASILNQSIFRRVFLMAISTIVLMAVSCQIALATPESNKALQTGIALFNQSKYMEALAEFNQAKAADSDNPLLHYYMASALLKLNHKEDAIREYKMTLLLDPHGRFTPFCESALRALGAASDGAVSVPKAATKTGSPSGTAGSGPPLNVQTSRPFSSAKAPVKTQALKSAVCLSVLCGCPLCQKLSLVLTDLNSKFGDKIDFQRTTMNATDDTSKALISRYSVHQCPTVLLINEQGERATEFQGNIPTADLCRDVEQVAKMATRTRYSSVEDKSLAEMRKMVVDEVESRISHDVERVDYQVKKIQQERDEQIANATGTTADRQAQKELLQSEAERKIKDVRDDFERRKREWYAAAEQRIKGISSTGPR